jgi:hypothetical protein
MYPLRKKQRTGTVAVEVRHDGTSTCSDGRLLMPMTAASPSCALVRTHSILDYPDEMLHLAMTFSTVCEIVNLSLVCANESWQKVVNERMLMPLMPYQQALLLIDAVPARATAIRHVCNVKLSEVETVARLFPNLTGLNVTGRITRKEMMDQSIFGPPPMQLIRHYPPHLKTLTLDVFFIEQFVHIALLPASLQSLTLTGTFRGLQLITKQEWSRLDKLTELCVMLSSDWFGFHGCLRGAQLPPSLLVLKTNSLAQHESLATLPRSLQVVDLSEGTH